jgi:hypothetical protein
MKTTILQVLRILVLACLAFRPGASVQAADATDWQPLFNGKDLAGWAGVNEVTCEVKDGNLRLVKGMGWLRTDKEYGDFVLELEWKALEKQYDSGIFIRCPLEGKPWPKDGWQVNLSYSALGTLVRGYKVTVPAPGDRIPVNEWAKMRIEVRGKKITLHINGERAWEYDSLDRDRGYIGIQAENKSFDFRNIRLQPLTSASQPAQK